MSTPIDPNPAVGRAADSLNETGPVSDAGTEVDPVGETAGEQVGGIDHIAASVETGQIGQGEVVDQILGEVRSMQLTRSVPSERRSDLMEALGDLLKNDPHLKSLLEAIPK
jgi:hypothetical protein